jgi:hypothetical protein
MPSSRSKCEKKGRVYVKKHKAYKDGPEIKSQCRKKSKSRKSKSRKSKSRSKKSRKSKSRSKKEKKGVKKSAEQEFRSLVKEICKNQVAETEDETPGEARSYQFGRGGLEYRPEPVARRPGDEIDDSMLGVFNY